MNYEYFIDCDGTDYRYATIKLVKEHIRLMNDEDKKKMNGLFVYRIKKNGETDGSFSRHIEIYNSHSVRLLK
jgi:hypothetical protein